MCKTWNLMTLKRINCLCTDDRNNDTLIRLVFPLANVFLLWSIPFLFLFFFLFRQDALLYHSSTENYSSDGISLYKSNEKESKRKKRMEKSQFSFSKTKFGWFHQQKESISIHRHKLVSNYRIMTWLSINQWYWHDGVRL